MMMKQQDQHPQQQAPQPQPQPQPQPNKKSHQQVLPTRKRAPVSCDRCKIRRSRCIRKSQNEACEDCQSNRVHCENTLPRKQRVYGSIETLSLRYRALEALIKGLFPAENIRELDTLFRIAEERGISMPARDDFTPADIFSSSAQQQQQRLGSVLGGAGGSAGLEQRQLGPHSGQITVPSLLTNASSMSSEESLESTSTDASSSTPNFEAGGKAA